MLMGRASRYDYEQPDPSFSAFLLGSLRLGEGLVDREGHDQGRGEQDPGGKERGFFISM